MSSTIEGGRRRDAGATRQALLDAARELFGERGFDATTLRDIGVQAGADPALIARYFGSKADLFSEAMAADSIGTPPTEAFASFDATVAYLIERVDRQGRGPLLQALMRSDASLEAQQEAAERIRMRFVAPLAAALQQRGVEQPQLRAEMAVAALLGIISLRSTGLFAALREPSTSELTGFVHQAFGDLVDRR